MAKTDKLFSLIQALTKSEKRYFKLTVSSIHEGEKNHIKLFDAVEKQKEYDEEKLKIQLQKEKFIKHLSSEKAYLYHLILKSLRNFHSEISVDAELHDTIRDIEILCNKMLLGPATQLIQKAYNKALEYERLSLALILLEYERKIHFNNSERQEKISEENKKLTKSIHNLNEYNQITIECVKIILSFGGGINTQEQEKQLRAFYTKSPLLKNSNHIYSFIAACKYYMINSAYHFYLNELEKSHYYVIELFHKFKEQPIKIEALNDFYKKNLINSIHLSYLLRKFDDARELLNELRYLPTNSEGLLEQKIYTTVYGLSIAILSGNTEEGRKMITQCEEVFLETTALEPYNVSHYMLSYKIAYFYFSTSNFKAALKWLNIILNKESIQDHILCRAHILFLITHYELHNHDYLGSVLISTSRLLHKKNMLTSAEKAIFAFLKKAPGLPPKEVVLSLKALKKQFEKICAEPFQRTTIDYFDYVSWAEAKSENKSMAEIMSRK